MGISVTHLSKSFDYYKKELGLKNSVRNLFHREKLVKAAELTELLDVRDLLSVQVRRLSLGERMKMELVAALLLAVRALWKQGLRNYNSASS